MNVLYRVSILISLVRSAISKILDLLIKYIYVINVLYRVSLVFQDFNLPLVRSTISNFFEMLDCLIEYIYIRYKCIIFRIDFQDVRSFDRIYIYVISRVDFNF